MGTKTETPVETSADKLVAIRRLPRFALETEVAVRLAQNVDTTGFPAILAEIGLDGPTLLWVQKIRSDLASLAAQAAEGGEIRVARKAGKDGDVKFALTGAKGETKESYATVINRLAKAAKAFADTVGLAEREAFDAMQGGSLFKALQRDCADWIHSKLEKMALEKAQPLE